MKRTQKTQKRKNGYYNLKITYEKGTGLYKCESLDNNYPYSSNPHLEAFAEDKKAAKEAVRILLDKCYNKKP